MSDTRPYSTDCPRRTSFPPPLSFGLISHRPCSRLSVKRSRVTKLDVRCVPRLAAKSSWPRREMTADIYDELRDRLAFRRSRCASSCRDWIGLRPGGANPSRAGPARWRDVRPRRSAVRAVDLAPTDDARDTDRQLQPSSSTTTTMTTNRFYAEPMDGSTDAHGSYDSGDRLTAV